ncbi:hypothetical protein RND81_04G100100 [Saponaria officinalis]|uniref:Uncharacterized protein n=1 Tax=Saponaria officinalis TaxID=3572 RepID=A0AAW1LI22_SAPOF
MTCGLHSLSSPSTFHQNFAHLHENHPKSFIFPFSLKSFNRIHLIYLENQHYCRMDVNSNFNVRLFNNGYFVFKKGELKYVGDYQLNLLTRLTPQRFTFKYIYDIAKYLVGDGKMASVWYRKYGKSLTNGRTLLKSNDEMSEVIRSKDKHNGIDMYITSTNRFPFSWD